VLAGNLCHELGRARSRGVDHRVEMLAPTLTLMIVNIPRTWR
jgi:hypothetical protein